MQTQQQTVNLTAKQYENNSYPSDSLLGQGYLMRFVNGFLCPENAELIKLLLRDCIDKEYSEKELISLEFNRNMTEGRLLDNYGFSISEIKSRCHHVWEKNANLGRPGKRETRYDMSKKARAVLDPDEFLYWTLLLILHDGLENPYPFTLYKMIASRRLQKYYFIRPKIYK